ncbi:MAG: nuclear transport factor 2 family protein [Cytophagales bacterium]
MEVEKIKKAITQNYIYGAFNETNIEAFKTIFHSEFTIINIQEDGSFFQFTRDMWEGVLQERVDNKTFDYSTVALTPEYKNVSIIENKASVTLDLLLNDKVVYTDFLLLTKINNEWKIVSKIYHEH